ncbi:MAG: DUF3108 domain-containing protein [Bacteroidia bacterium]
MQKSLILIALLPLSMLLPSFRPIEPVPGEPTPPASELRKVKNESFKRGELLKYRLHYGIIDAGTAEIEVTDENKIVNERPTMHIVGRGYSRGAFDFFFKVRDRYESFVDEGSLAPVVFLRKVDEGGYKINQDQVYDHEKQKVMANGKTYDIPQYTQDMLSAFYFARTMDMTQAKVGDVFAVKSFIDNEIWELKIKFMGKETISTSLGKIKCLRFHPIVQKGRVFKKEEDLNVWISDDKNHIPVRAQAEVLIGSVKMDLSSFSNLANPLAKE